MKNQLLRFRKYTFPIWPVYPVVHINDTDRRAATATLIVRKGHAPQVLVFTMPGTAQFFGSLGPPSAAGYLAFAAELIGGVMLILGVYPRYAAIALLPVLLGALWARAGNGWLFSAPNGGWKCPLFLRTAGVVQFLLGDGALALRPSEITWRSRS